MYLWETLAIIFLSFSAHQVVHSSTDNPWYSLAAGLGFIGIWAAVSLYLHSRGKR